MLITMTPVEDLIIDAFLIPGGPMSSGSFKTTVIRLRTIMLMTMTPAEDLMIDAFLCTGTFLG